MRRRELMAQGLSAAEAQQAALQKFGDLRRARRECRAIGHQREQRMRVFQYLSELRQDAAFSIRQMFATPAFTIVAIATLALGIGGAAAHFSAGHTPGARPPPNPEP